MTGVSKTGTTVPKDMWLALFFICLYHNFGGQIPVTIEVHKQHHYSEYHANYNTHACVLFVVWDRFKKYPVESRYGSWMPSGVTFFCSSFISSS